MHSVIMRFSKTLQFISRLCKNLNLITLLLNEADYYDTQRCDNCRTRKSYFL